MDKLSKRDGIGPFGSWFSCKVAEICLFILVPATWILTLNSHE